jgi:hypothetical protein
MGPLKQQHDHEGHCSGRIRKERGKLLAEIVCEACGAVVKSLGAVR